MKRTLPLLAALLLPALAGLYAADTEATRPNVLLFLADDLGYGDLSCYNAKSKVATPHIDRLAKQGMRFTDAVDLTAVTTAYSDEQCVWSYDDVGGNGNRLRLRGATFMSVPGGLRLLQLGELMSSAQDWRAQVHARCVPKLRAIGVREGICNNATDPDTEIETFTLSPTGLQIYFNPYAIASGADGEFVVYFDCAELKDLLGTDGPAASLPRAPWALLLSDSLPVLPSLPPA